MSTNTKGIYYSTSADAPITEEARSLALANSVPVGQNYIINGAMDFWQRGTSSTAAGYQTADRWYGNASNTTTFSQESSTVPTGFRYAYKMTAGATGAPYFEQPVETLQAVGLAGKTATFSAYLAASASITVSMQLYYSTSVDVAASGSWTLVGSSNVSVTTSYSRGSTTVSVPSTAKSLKASIVGPSQASGAYILATGVQLEEGSTATPFRRHGMSLQGEFMACQRYYQTGGFGGTYYLGTSNGTGVGAHDYTFVPMRVSPTITNTGFTNADNASNGGHAVISNGRVLGYYRNANTSYPYYNFTSTFKLEAEL